MKKLILIISMLAMSALSFNASAESTSKPFKSGDKVTVQGYCMSMLAVMFLADKMKELGIEGYNLVMKSQALPCVDAQLLPQYKPVTVTLDKRVFTITLTHLLSGDTNLVQFWLAHDVHGRPGYTWNIVDGQVL